MLAIAAIAYQRILRGILDDIVEVSDAVDQSSILFDQRHLRRDRAQTFLFVRHATTAEVSLKP